MQLQQMLENEMHFKWTMCAVILETNKKKLSQRTVLDTLHISVCVKCVQSDSVGHMFSCDSCAAPTGITTPRVPVVMIA